MQEETKKRITAQLDVARNPRHKRLWEAAKTIEKGQQAEIILALFEDTFDLTDSSSLGRQVYDYLARRESGLPLPPRKGGASVASTNVIESQGTRLPPSALKANTSTSLPSSEAPATQANPEGTPGASKPAPTRRQSVLNGLTAGAGD